MIWQLNAQSNSFEQWDKNYIEVNLDELLSFEYEYAGSIRTIMEIHCNSIFELINTGLQEYFLETGGLCLMDANQQ